MSEASPLRRAGLVMVAVTLAARAFGYVREAVIAHAYGASREVDLFLAGMIIPAIIASTAYYAVPNALVPLWALEAVGRARARAAALGIVILASLIAAAVAFFSVSLTRILVGGFELESQVYAASILRVGSLSIVFAAIEAVLRSRLQAAKRFGLPGLAYIWQGAGVVIAVLGWQASGALGMTWGLTGGTCAAVLWNLSLLLGLRERNEPAAKTHLNPVPIGQVWVWVAATLITDSFAQLYGLVDRHYGSYLDAGRISALNYASLIGGLPLAFIGTAISTVILPFLSEAEAESNQPRASSIVDRSVQWALIIGVPVSIWMIIFRNEIVGILLQRGAFDATARDLTAGALGAIAFGIVPAALATVWSRSFYAARRWRPMIFVALIAFAVKIASSEALAFSIGILGLALSTSFTWLVAAVIVVMIQRDQLRPLGRPWAILLAKIMVLAAPPGIATWGILQLIEPIEFSHRIAIALAGMLIGVIVFVVYGPKMGISQLRDIRAIGGPSKTRDSR
jgi:putative peptidoglycan lipid II flippase